MGKKIRLDDYKFNFGKQDVYLSVYTAFKDVKSGNKYIVYSYDNDKLLYGSLFVRDNKITIMTSEKESDDNLIKRRIDDILSDKKDDDFEEIDLDEVINAQIIDEKELKIDVDLNKLEEITIPKPKVVEETPAPVKKKFSFAYLGLFILFVFVAAYLYINPEVIKGKNEIYECTKSYSHSELPATVNEVVDLTFTSKGIISATKLKSDFVFTDTDYYVEFRDKSYFYRYFKEGDTYKFEDSSYTYRLFSEVDVTKDYFLPSEKDELLSYYNNEGYVCKKTGDE